MSGEAWSEALEAELTFAKIFARHAYWRENPPTPVLLMALAVGLGVWKQDPPMETDAVVALRGMFPSGRI
jgi:hypothetical protein